MEADPFKRQLFHVKLSNINYICWAMDREDAKQQAKHWIGSDPDNYIVTPLSNLGDRVHIALTLPRYLNRRKMSSNFYIIYDNQREDFDEKGAALRRAAALIKFKKAVIKVYDKHGNFIKSFDGR